jgi:hypothetical protein
MVVMLSVENGRRESMSIHRAMTYTRHVQASERFEMRMKTIDYSAVRREWVLPDLVHRYIMLRHGSEWIIYVHNTQTGEATNCHRINARELVSLAKSKEAAMRNYRGQEKPKKEPLKANFYKPQWD